MSSQLYKVLNNIEKGRQNLVSALNENNFNLPKNASLQQMASAVKTLNYQINYPKDEEWQD
jgi:hypothetical protein